MALYTKNQSWINAVNSGTNLDNEFNNIYASLVDLDTNKVSESTPATDITVTNLTSTNAVIDRPTFHISDAKATGTGGGDFNSGTWVTRTLNTTIRNTISSSSLAANQFILPAGSYLIMAASPASNVDLHKIRIQNITDGTTLTYGTTEIAPTGSQNYSIIRNFYFTIAGTKTFELQHRCQTTVSSIGLGRAFGTSIEEYYSEVIITKVG